MTKAPRTAASIRTMAIQALIDKVESETKGRDKIVAARALLTAVRDVEIQEARASATPSSDVSRVDWLANACDELSIDLITCRFAASVVFVAFK